MKTAILFLSLLSLSSPAGETRALVFLIAGQSNAGGVAAFSHESNVKSGIAGKHPAIPGSTAGEVGIPITMDAYPRSHIWGEGFERLKPGKNLKGGYKDPNRHGIELPMAMLLEEKFPDADKFFIKHGPCGAITEGDIVTVHTADPKAEPVVINHSDVKSIEVSPISQMPPGLINSLSADELRDLVAYLMSRGNPEDPMFRK